MLSIDALDAVYPDARFVMTHRDVAKVLPSVCALYDTLLERPHRPARPARHRRPQRRRCGARAARAAHRLPRPRQRGPVPRPVVRSGAARSDRPRSTELYAELGDELTDDARRRMEAWWAESSKDRSGPARYSARDVRARPRGDPRPVRLLQRPVRRPRRLRSTPMDEITQKVVDGTAWREFCDLLADAGEVDPRRGQPRRPARPRRGLPHAHPAAARRAREPSSSTAGRASP